MAKPIRHIHVRRFHAPLAQVVASIDALWSGSELDALPRALRGWRRTPANSQGFAVGTRFGHGPFSFIVEQWDGRSLRARIETAGFVGHHGFALAVDGDEVVVTHDLDAMVVLPYWIVWQLFIAASHDWAVQAILDRMHVLLNDRGVRPATPPPLRLRAFAVSQRLIARVTGTPRHGQARTA